MICRPRVKDIAIILLSLCCCSILEAKGSREEPESESPLVFSMLYSDNASYPYKEDWATLQLMTERTGVKLDIIAVPEADFDTKRQIVMSSGNIPHIITKTQAHQVSDYALKGLFLPINHYLDRLPQLNTFIREHDYQREIVDLTEYDGNWYQLPIKASTSRIQSQVWTYRSDIFRKHNLTVPDTMEEVYRICSALKKLYPESYPITNRFGKNNILSVVAPSFGTRAGWNLGSGGYRYIQETDRWIFAPSSQNFKAMLIWLNKMLEQGYLDPEFASLNNNVYEKKIESGKTFLMLDWLGNELRYYKNARRKVPEFTISAMIPPAGPDGHRGIRAVSRFEQGWVISSQIAEHENFDKFLQFLDWFYSPEGIELFAWGIEGDTFYTDAQGQKHYTEKVLNGSYDLSIEIGALNNCLTAVYPLDAYLERLQENDRKVLMQIVELDAVPPPEPKLLPSKEDREKMNLLQGTLTEYYNEMIENFLFGNVSFDQWDAYAQECEKKGAAELGVLINAIWKKQKKN